MMKKHKRIIINKPSIKKCDICQKEISLYSFSSHVKWNHNLTSDDYSQLYGEFRQIKRPTNRNIKKIKCELCNKSFSSVGLFTHFRDSHNITPDEYVSKFGEYRESKLRQLEYKNRQVPMNDKQTCLICNEEFPSGILLGYHIKNVHRLQKNEYINKYVFKGVHPVCKCGCGRKVKILNYYPYYRDYISSHNPNAMLGKHHSILSKEKMSLKAMERLSVFPSSKINTKPELEFEQILKHNNEKYIHPHQTKYGLIDFFLPDRNWLIEIDGSYWHPIKIEGLNFRLLPNIISAKRKMFFTNLIRIRENDINKIHSISDIQRFNINYNFNISYRQKIIYKEFFEACLELKGENYLRENVWLLLKFIREIHPDFPYPPCEEIPSDVVQKILNYKIKNILDEKNRTFSNNISNIGVSWLKSHFKSFWKSSFKGNKSPLEAWMDDSILKQIISYRIGINDSKEVFDFSLHQIIRGISARRLTVSFFSPLLAYGIYKTILKNKQSPIVLDPCCGFGGRLLGFKSAYPHGTYIGCEPNIETYNELIQLKENAKWENVKIYNCKFEDYKDTYDVDLTFTSIPYYDIEVYSNNINYSSFDEWKNTFIKSFEKCKNCYINVPMDLSKKLNWDNKISFKIKKNICHFNKNKIDKSEYIIRLN